jgi:acyl CoA:acetate/3-ketoacid CoA transferase beta subunit
VVTPLCTMNFDVLNQRAGLASVHPGVAIDQVVAQTGFDLSAAGNIPVTPCPTNDELAVLRQIDSSGLLRKGAA